jgi:large subunit ribosomal protein L10
MKKSEKTFFVDNLAEELKSASSIVLVDYAGLGVKAQQDLKKRLKKVNATMVVVKNTLLKLAGAKATLEKEILEDSVLSGPTAMVITEGDPIAPLQILAKYAKEFELPQLKVGIIDGSFQDKVNLIALSSLPSKDILAGQVVGAIAGPIYGLLGTLQGNLQKLVYILNEYKSSKTA